MSELTPLFATAVEAGPFVAGADAWRPAEEALALARADPAAWGARAAAFAEGEEVGRRAAGGAWGGGRVTRCARGRPGAVERTREDGEGGGGSNPPWPY